MENIDTVKKEKLKAVTGSIEGQQSRVNTKESEVFRVVISKDSNEALESALDRCTEGFDSGNITKSDLANYIFQNLHRFFVEADVKNLRATHFDEKKVLGSILKTETDLPEELKKAIRSHFGITEKEKKRTPRSSSELSTEQAVDNSKTQRNSL